MLIDADWCWLMLVDADWYQLMLIDADWCWLICWLMLIDAQIRFNWVFFCRSVPTELLRSFFWHVLGIQANHHFQLLFTTFTFTLNSKLVSLSLSSRHSPHLWRRVPLFGWSSCRYGHWRGSCSWQVQILQEQRHKQITKTNNPKPDQQTNAEVESIVQCFLFRLYPPLSNIQEISVQIAKKVGKHCVSNKMIHIRHSISVVTKN